MIISYRQSKSLISKKIYNLPILVDVRYKVKNILSLEIASDSKTEKFDLDFYLFPFFEEFERLEAGVVIYDMHTDTYFNLEAFVCLVTGDTPAISKLFQLSGHIETYPCRACISGTPYLNRYLTKYGANKGETGKNTRGYYPLSPPIKFLAQYPSTKRKHTSAPFLRESERSSFSLSWRLHPWRRSKFDGSKPAPYIWYQGYIIIYIPFDDIFSHLDSIWHHAFSLPEFRTRSLCLI